jgi:hypothetical protein
MRIDSVTSPGVLGVAAGLLLVGAISIAGEGAGEPRGRVPAISAEAPEMAFTGLVQAIVRELEADKIPVPCPKSENRDALRYAASQVDLNGDSVPETLALLLSGVPRGTAFVLRDTAQGLDVIATIEAASAPIFVADVASHGWRTLIVSVAGAGAEGGTHLLEYDGASYPDNASLAPLADDAVLAEAGEPVLSETDAYPSNMRLLTRDDCAAPGPIVERESLAGIRPGDGRSALAAAELGARDPDDDTSRPQQRDKDRRFQWRWSYSERGVVVQLKSKRRGPPWDVEQIMIWGPGAKGLTTSSGVGIGASREDVEKAYSGAAIEMEEGFGEQADRLIVRSGEDYLEFTLDRNGIVERIFLGPEPE